MEKAMFPMKTLRVTQGAYTSYSHKQSWAIDLGGVDSGRDKVFAPFSGTVRRIRSTNNEMWITSDGPVEWADGRIAVMTCLFIHANSIPIADGAHFNQGDWIYNEGDKGQVTGAHLHIECAEGEFVSPYGYYNTGVSFGSGTVWKIYNQVRVNEALFVGEDVNIVDAGTDGSKGGAAIEWVRASSTTSGTPLPENTFFTVTAKNLEFMHSTDVNDVCWDVNGTGYLDLNATYHAIEQAVVNGFTWWKFRYSDGNLYWCGMVDGRFTTETASFNSDVNMYFTVKENPVQVYNSIDLFDKVQDTEKPGAIRTITAVSEKQWFGYTWYKYSTGTGVLYIPDTDDITVTEGEKIWESLPSDYVVKPIVINCEYFNSPDVYDIAPNQYLEKDYQYTAKAQTVQPINGYNWIRFEYTDGKDYYTTNESNRCVLGLRTSEPTHDYDIKEFGIDVSKYQGNINWDLVANDPKKPQFAFIKCVSTSSSLYVDPYFVANVQGAQSKGIATGAYIYTYAVTKDYADSEIAMAVQQLTPYKMGYPIAWDCEDARLHQSLSKSQLTDMVLYALGKIRSYGFYPILYTYTNYANTYLDMNRINDAGYDVWIADYRSSLGYTGPIKIWQYTSSGTVSGISGNVDCNTSYWDYPEYIKALGLNGFSGSGDVYPATPYPGYHIEVYNQHVEWFSYPSIYAEIHGYLPIGNYQIESKLNNQYDGFDFYTIEYNGDTVYVAYNPDGRMGIVKDEPAEYDIPYDHTIYEDKNLVFEVRNTHVEICTKPDVNDENRIYFTPYKTARLYAKLNGIVNGFEWYVLIVDGTPWYFGIVDDGRFVTYSGIPYQRTSITDGSMFQIIGSGAYAVPYPMDSPSGETELSVGNAYSISAKLTFNYNSMEWYVIQVNGNEMYAPVISNAVIVGQYESYDETLLDDTWFARSTNTEAKLYKVPNTSSEYTTTLNGEVFQLHSIVHTDPSKNPEINWNEVFWYTTIDQSNQTWYLQSSFVVDKAYFKTYQELNTVSADPKLVMDGTISIFPYPREISSDNIPAQIYQVTDLPINGKVSDIIGGKTWYSYDPSHLSSIGSDIDSDAENLQIAYVTDLSGIIQDAQFSLRYNYIIASVPMDSYMKALDGKYEVYDHVTYQEDGTTIPEGTLIPLTGKIVDETLSDQWYTGTYGGETVYLKDAINSDIVYIYTENDVDPHLVITTKVDTVKACLYIDDDCTAYSVLPNNYSFKPLASITDTNGSIWYKAEFNNAIVYIKDSDTDLIKSTEYDSTLAIEGTYLQIANDSTVYAYKIPGETSGEKITLTAGNKYPVRAYIDEPIGESKWVSIVYDDSTIWFSEITEYVKIIYWYESVACPEDSVMEIYPDITEFPVYANPIDNKPIGYIVPGQYDAIKQLSNFYGGEQWYIIRVNLNLVYAPIIENQSRILIFNIESILEEIEEVEALLNKIRQELDTIIPQTSTLLLAVQKARVRMDLLDLKLRLIKVRIQAQC